MDVSNKIINSLWVGDYLENLELLTLRSFTHHGHSFHLWVYDELETPIPEGVVLKDANEIIPASEIFYYKHGEKSGLGRGSVAGFSDIFRYKLMYEKGGWWVDMDVTCLKPFDFEADYVFRTHDFFPVVGNLMKCPAGSTFMHRCYEEAKERVTANNRKWVRPIMILNKHLEQLQLTQYISADIVNHDRWEYIRLYKDFPTALPEPFYALHWMNEEWRKHRLSKNTAAKNSVYERLLLKYDLPHQTSPARSPDFYYFYLLSRARLIPQLPIKLRTFLKEF